MNCQLWLSDKISMHSFFWGGFHGRYFVHNRDLARVNRFQFRKKSRLISKTTNGENDIYVISKLPKASLIKWFFILMKMKLIITRKVLSLVAVDENREKNWYFIIVLGYTSPKYKTLYHFPFLVFRKRLNL